MHSYKFRTPFYETRGYTALYIAVHVILLVLMVAGLVFAFLKSPYATQDPGTYSIMDFVLCLGGLIPAAIGLAVFASGEQIMDKPYWW